MGMYTDLICKAVIKDEYCNKIYKIINQECEWKDLFDDEFVNNSYADWIPFGEYNDAKFDNNILSFECSLIDRDMTYYDFFEFLKTISDEIIEFKTHYEDAKEWIDKDTEEIYWKNWLTDKYETTIYKHKGD